MNESTARNWFEAHATASVAAADPDPERIDELTHYDGTVQELPVQTKQAEQVGRFVKHHTGGGVEKVESLHEKNGRCAFVRSRPEHDASRFQFVLNTLMATLGARPLRAPNQIEDIKEYRQPLAYAAGVTVLLPLGVAGASMTAGTPLFQFLLFLLAHLGFFSAISVIIVLAISTSEALRSHRSEPKQTVALFDADEAESELRSTAPELARTIYGKKTKYFEAEDEADESSYFDDETKTD